METQSAKEDGRHARLERNKTEVVRALLELVRETGEVPRAEVIAQKANVSRRSVFRFFDDRADLVRATTEFMYREVLQQFPFPALSGLPPAERVISLVDHLGAVYEYCTPVRQVAERLKTSNRLIREEQDRIQAMYRPMIHDALFDGRSAHVPDRQILVDTLELICSWKAWNFLRSDAGHAVDRAKAVMVHLLRAVLE